MGFLGHMTSNLTRSLGRSVTSLTTSKSDLSAYYEAHLGRLAANFALCSDLSLVLGGRLKFEEMVSGRLADAFGTLYLGYACLWYYQNNKNVQGIDAVFEMAMETLLQQNQNAIKGLSENFPIPAVGPLMRLLSFPLGSQYKGRFIFKYISHMNVCKLVYLGATDKMRKSTAKLVSTPSGIRDLLSQGIFISKDPNDRLIAFSVSNIGFLFC